MKTAHFLLSILLLSPVISFAQQAELQFVDECSGEVRGMTTPNGTEVRVNFKGLKPHVPLQLTLTYSLAGIPQEKSKKHEFSEYYEYLPTEASGVFSASYLLPHEDSLSEIEDMFPGSHIWVLTAEWQQDASAGNTVGSIYRTESTEDFYRITSAAVCHWDTSPVVTSKYHFNRDQPLMTITRVVSYHDHSGYEGGREIGIGNNYPHDANGIPTNTGNIPLPFMPYYLKNQTTRTDLQLSFVLERQWSLVQGQGGFFADRYSFDRLKADQYHWKIQSNGCGEYIKTKTGFLDVGVHTSDFYSVPSSFAGSGEKTLRFINSFRPPLDTCDKTYPRNAVRADVKVTAQDEILFFHERKN